ncbi:MAG: DUF2141 domain-containing protein [Erythrobacter sp.]
MKSRAPRLRHAAIACALGTGVLGAGMLGAAAPAQAGEIVITITNMRSQEGVVRACMTTQESVFPKCRDDPAAYRTVVPANSSATIRFNNVEPGNYAIALLHDENDNGKADRALGMMPTEGFGFSRDARVRFGPPKFRDAVFEHGMDDQELVIRMRYLL